MQALSENITTPALHNVTFKVEGREDGQGYLSAVNTTSEYGVIVLQEWWGLNKSMMTTSDVLAQQGFRALAPDLYRGKVAKNHEEAGHLMTGLDWTGAISDIEGAANYLRSQGCKKVGCIGYCMGGALTIAAMTATDIDAGAPFYGVPDLNKFAISNIKGPIYGHFGETDAMKGFSAPEDGLRLQEAGQAAGKDVKVKIWQGVGHAFMNQDREGYNKDLALEALMEVTQFFKTVFGA